MDLNLFLFIVIGAFVIELMFGIERNYYLGVAKCNKCWHIGKCGLRFRFFRGFVTVCKECHSENLNFNYQQEGL